MAENNKPEILDLDVIKPPKRAFKLAGKEIDVTIIPFDVMLDIADNIDKFQSLDSQELKGEELKAILELLYRTTIKVCGHSDEKITEEWLKKNADVIQLISLMGFIIRPLFQKVADSKNLLAAGLVGSPD